MHCSSVTAASLHLQPCQQHLCIYSKALQFSHSGAPASNIFPMALCHSAAILFAMALPASSSAAALRLATVPRRPCQQKLRHGALASNKPHPAEKCTPVWLAIWCTWAGFANSQLRCATFHSTYSYKCTSSLLPTWSRCSDIANLSAHLRRLPTPPPYLRRMRLSPGHGRMYQMVNDDATWPGHCSSQIPPPLREERKRNTLLNPTYLETFSRK